MDSLTRERERTVYVPLAYVEPVSKLTSIEIVSGEKIEAPDETSGVVRSLAFETENALVVRSRVAGGITTDWHHNGDRHVYGYVVEGRAVLEYGPGGADSLEADAGDFVYVPPRTIRRVVNPTDEEWVIVITFVGSGPPAVTVDGPEPE